MKQILYLFLFIGLFQQLQAQDTIPEANVSEPVMQNVSRITGGNPIVNPVTVVEVGSKITSFSYTDTKNTTNTNNGYAGRNPNDVFYKFTLIAPMEITATHCGSELNDTYMTLLDASQNVITYNDDYSGEGRCPNSYHSVIKQQLAAGTYYIVSEGYNSNGNITTNITGTVTNIVPILEVYLSHGTLSLTEINQTAQLEVMIIPSNATNKNVTWSSSSTYVATVSSTGLVTAKAEGITVITVTTQQGNYTVTCPVYVTIGSSVVDVGTKSGNFTYTNTRNTALTGNNYTARNPNDILYMFTLTVPMEITASHCESELNDTYMHLLDASKNTIVSVDDYSGEGHCSNTYHPVIKRQLAAGTYYIVSEGYSESGKITTTITGTANVPVTGVSLNQTSLSLSAGTSAQLTATVAPSNATNRNVTWTSSNTTVATVSSTGQVTAAASGQTTITVTTADGNLTATCTVNVAFADIDLGTKSAPFTYTDTRNTANTGNNYTGRSPNDVLYKFTLTIPMEITATHCGSELNDTYMTLLDASKNVITYTDDYSGEGRCPNSYHSVIKRQLAAGTYYIVSEGYNGNGNITTTITAAIITYTYSTDGAGGTLSGGTAAGNYPAGTTITLPTVATRTDYNFAGFTCPSVWTGTKNPGGTFSMPATGVTVTANWTPATVSVTGVTLNQTSLSLTAIDQTAQLTVTVSPANATNKNVNWSSNNTSIATVSTTGLVTAKADGTTLITVATVDGTRTATCNVTVTIPIEPYVKATPVAASPSSGQNYIKTTTYTSENGTCFMDAVQYYDGLGQPSQAVQVGVTPNQYDLVTLQEYDNFGRESKAWLPATVSGNNGAFVSDFQSKSTATYNNTTYNSAADSKPFAYPVYEPSPLNRVTQQFGPGASWHSGGKSINTDYLTNSSAYPCAYHYMDGNNLKRNNNYGDGQLYVTKTTDEEGTGILYEFKDKLGRVVLQRQMDDTDPHDTYYIYDDFNNLRYVLPPMVAAGNYDENDAAIKNYAYVYKYDARNRCIYKKLPGCEAVYYAYDKADRLIFSQDGEQRANGNKWMFTLYDILGRTVVSGTCTNSIDYNNNPIKDVVVTASTSTGSELKGYSSSYTISNPVALTANYYDGYDFRGFISSTSFDANAGAEFNKQYTASHKGLLTGTLTAVLDGNTTPGTYLYSVMYYDYKGRIIQTVSSNHIGGTEKEYVAYTLVGQPEKRKHVHTASGKPTQTETYGYDYDHAERLARTRYTLNSNPEVLMNKNEYDELGRLKTTTPYRLENFKSTYAYGIRSWINRIAGTPYTEDLTYKFNGNVGTMQWVQGGTERKYTFTYDGLSRIKAADYLPASENFSTTYDYDKHGNLTSLTRGTQDNLTFNNNSTNQLYNISDSRANSASNSVYEFKNYSTVTTQEYWYNANGAMTKDLNKGVLDVTYNTLNLPLKVDILSPAAEARNEYSYSAGGQKLRVVRKWNNGYSTNPVVGTNTTLDVSHLNTRRATDYVGNIIYEEGTLKRILTENGYYDGQNYYFYVKNHLGSNVMVINRNTGNSAQNNHYYPFGLTMSISDNQGVQAYKYTGKELDMEHGLMQYDYEARQYDPAVGRFTTMDPLAEKYYSISPYAYCGNNPVNAVDRDGRDIVLINAYKTNDTRGGYKARRDVSATMQATLKDFMKTTEGRNFFGQFAKVGDVVGEYKFEKNGVLSDKTLTLIDYSFEEGYNSNLPISIEGSIKVKDSDVTVRVVSFGEKKADVGEILTHETQLHGYKVENEMKGKSTTTTVQDHKALKSQDKTHKGYQKYDSTRKQLEAIDPTYKNAFKKAEEHAKRNY